MIVLDELRQRQRHALGHGRQEHGGARQPGLAAADGGFDQILFRLPQPGAAPFDKQGEWLQQPNANIRRHCRQKVDSSLTANAL
jgi:hypothetical protein